MASYEFRSTEQTKNLNQHWLNCESPFVVIPLNLHKTLTTVRKERPQNTYWSNVKYLIDAEWKYALSRSIFAIVISASPIAYSCLVLSQYCEARGNLLSIISYSQNLLNIYAKLQHGKYDFFIIFHIFRFNDYR